MLLANARAFDPEGTIEVTARTEGARAVVEVADRDRVRPRPGERLRAVRRPPVPTDRLPGWRSSARWRPPTAAPLARAARGRRLRRDARVARRGRLTWRDFSSSTTSHRPARCCDILEGAGHGVTEARDGAEALAFLERTTFDLVLTDRRMPAVDGLELLRRIRARTSPPPVVVLTAHGSIPEAVEAVRLGAADYIAKPLPSPEALVDLVASLLPREDDGEIVTADPAMKELLDLVDQAPRDVAVLVTGESGGRSSSRAGSTPARPARRGRLSR